jgi:hypothetical protein
MQLASVNYILYVCLKSLLENESLGVGKPAVPSSTAPVKSATKQAALMQTQNGTQYDDLYDFADMIFDENFEIKRPTANPSKQNLPNGIASIEEDTDDGMVAFHSYSSSTSLINWKK